MTGRCPCGERRLRAGLWLVALLFALHEAEEWNLVPWLEAHFEPGPAVSERGLRALLVLFAALGVSYTAACLLLLRTRAALHALLPLFLAVFLGNALTHVAWTLRFGGYAPGVATSLAMIPLVLGVTGVAWREGRVSAVFLAPFALIAAIQPVGAALAGGTLSGPQLALHRLGGALAAWLWGGG